MFINFCLLSYLFTDIFSQISDSNGVLIHSKFDEYLKLVLQLPTAVFEGPSFGYNEMAAQACFNQGTVSESYSLYLVPF